MDEAQDWMFVGGTAYSSCHPAVVPEAGGRVIDR
jgi:hypothetical protein